MNVELGTIEQKVLTLNKQGYGVFVAINKTDLKGRKAENEKVFYRFLLCRVVYFCVVFFGYNMKRWHELKKLSKE